VTLDSGRQAKTADGRRDRLNQRLRAAFIEGAEEDSWRRLGRGLTREELERVYGATRGTSRDGGCMLANRHTSTEAAARRTEVLIRALGRGATPSEAAALSGLSLREAGDRHRAGACLSRSPRRQRDIAGMGRWTVPAS
jgi:hypothetical protein